MNRDLFFSESVVRTLNSTKVKTVFEVMGTEDHNFLFERQYGWFEDKGRIVAQNNEIFKRVPLRYAGGRRETRL